MKLRNKALLTGLMGFALVSGSGIFNSTPLNFLSGTANARAEEDGSGAKGSAYQGPHGMGQRGPEDRPSDTTPGKGSGQGGPVPGESDAKGPRFQGGGGGGAPSERGGKPAWAQEGIPEDVELGRLNVARSPDSVLQRALDETVATWNPDMESFYELTAAQAADELENNYDSVVRFDSPLANLAFYQQLLTTGTTQLPGVDPASTNDLAAILLGSASDKTVAVTEGTVEAVNLIMGIEMTQADVTAIAEGAEAVRSAIDIGHGE